MYLCYLLPNDQNSNRPCGHALRFFLQRQSFGTAPNRKGDGEDGARAIAAIAGLDPTTQRRVVRQELARSTGSGCRYGRSSRGGGCFYVAMTRARDDLVLMQPLRFFIPRQPRGGDAHVFARRSLFIAECDLDAFELIGSHFSCGAENETAGRPSPTSI